MWSPWGVLVCFLQDNQKRFLPDQSFLLVLSYPKSWIPAESSPSFFLLPLNFSFKSQLKCLFAWVVFRLWFSFHPSLLKWITLLSWHNTLIQLFRLCVKDTLLCKCPLLKHWCLEDKRGAYPHPRARCTDGFHDCLLLRLWLPSFILKAKKLMISDLHHPIFNNSLFLKVDWSFSVLLGVDGFCYIIS